MKQQTKVIYLIVVLAIICGSGLLIWLFNFFQGNNLSQPPQFDLSEYNDLGWATPSQVFAKLFADKQIKEEAKDKFIEEFEQTYIKKDIEFEQNAVYFQESFKGQTAQETRHLIDNFSQDFPELKNCSYHDLAAQKCYSIKISADDQPTVLASLQASSVAAVNKIEPSDCNYELCFGIPVYASEAAGYVRNYPLVAFEAPANEDLDYIAYLKCENSNEALSKTFNKLKTDFSDLVKVINQD